MSLNKIKILSIIIAFLALLSACKSKVVNPMESMSDYVDDGIIFSHPTDIIKLEKDIATKEKDSMTSCKKYVQDEGKKNKAAKKQLQGQQKQCENLFNSKWTKTNPQWLQFKSKVKKGDVIYVIGKKSQKGRGGFGGYAIVRGEKVIATFIAVRS